MLKWLALWTFFAVWITAIARLRLNVEGQDYKVSILVLLLLITTYAAKARDATPAWITEESFLFSHRNRRMINGTLVDRKEGSWHIALRALRDGGWYFAGSGSIISTKWAVTAAHCVCKGPTPDVDIKAVSAGSIQAWGGSVHAIAQIICHPLYNSVLEDVPITYDIAVISVRRPFEFDATTKAVSLPNVGDSFPVSVGSIRGWGSTQIDGYGMSQELQRIDMTTLSEYDCNHYLRAAFRNSTNYYGQICAQGLHNGYICFGDSGSPLIIDGVLVGIASWIHGDTCAGTPDPAVFTSAYTFRNWIKITTKV